MYACACRWSVTGIRRSRKGGVIKPIWKAGGRERAGSVSVTAEFGEERGVSGGAMDKSSFVAMSRIAARRGRSLEDWNQGIAHASSQQNVNL